MIPLVPYRSCKWISISLYLMLMCPKESSWKPYLTSQCRPHFIFSAETPLICRSRNWIVIVPDYESSTDAFGAGKQSGQAVLDGIRAFLSSSILPSTMAKPKVALWGYSGGALASGWAASIQGDYAPELESVLVGAAIGGTPVDLRAIAYHTNGGIAAGLIGMCMP